MYQATGEYTQAAADIIGYGGAAYGGKRYWPVILARVAAEVLSGVQNAYFRRNYPAPGGAGASVPKNPGVYG